MVSRMDVETQYLLWQYGQALENEGNIQLHYNWVTQPHDGSLGFKVELQLRSNIKSSLKLNFGSRKKAECKPNVKQGQ